MRPAISDNLRTQIRHLEHGCCAYCQTPEALTVTTFEIDHITPLSAGGATVQENLCLACPACNRHKGTRQTALDPVSGTNVALYHPRREAWQVHFQWDLKTYELLGLTPPGRATIVAFDLNRPALLHVRHLWAKLGYFPPTYYHHKTE